MVPNDSELDSTCLTQNVENVGDILSNFDLLSESIPYPTGSRYNYK